MRYVVVFSDGYRSDPMPWENALNLIQWALRRAGQLSGRPVRVEAAAAAA